MFLEYVKRAAAMFACIALVEPGAALAGPVNISGPPAPRYASIDRAIEAFMRAQNVHNAEFGLSEHGRTVMSHAYTNGAAAVTPSTIFRLASNSKAWTSAAIETLFKRGTISRATLAFKYLGITKPLPLSARVDRRVFTITVGNLIDHKSGWDDTRGPKFDPTHEMRTIALRLHMRSAIDETVMVRYMLGQPLQEPPGATYAYCNFCYDVLGMIVEKATHTKLAEYLARNVAAPIGVHNVVISPTLEPRLRDEVRHYYSPLTGPSAIHVLSNARVPDPNGGDSLIREVDAGAGGLATNAESELALMNRYIIWGVGPPNRGVDSAREGSDEGTNTWAEQRADGKNWALLFNTRNFKGGDPTFEHFMAQIDTLLNKLP